MWNKPLKKLFDYNDEQASKLLEKYKHSDPLDPSIPFCIRLARARAFEQERQRLERIFQCYQQSLSNHPRRDEIIKNKLGNFWNKEDRYHFSCYFELEVFDFLQQKVGLLFEIEPSDFDNKNPDFQINTSPPIVVEVATVFDDEGTSKQIKNYEAIRYAISTIEHDRFRVSLLVNELPEQIISNKQLKKLHEFACNFLQKAERGEQVDKFQQSGLQVELELIPYQAKEPGSVLALSTGLGFWLTAEPAKKAIKKKIQKYKSLKDSSKCFIIALGIHAESITKTEVIDMLLKDNNGGLLNGGERGPSGEIRNQRVSGVLIVSSRVDQKLVRSCEYCLVHNPHANNPLNRKIFEGKCEQVQNSHEADVGAAGESAERVIS